MSGHSKWKNIMHKKEKTDSQRGKIATKIGRELAIAVREGGADPTSNAKLRDIIAKAKANNLPNDNITRMISKADGDGANYESVRYEGYGPCGVAVIVDAMSDNRNRIAGEMRHYFDKYGGNLGPANCVSWQFDNKGVLVIERGELSEDDVMIAALEAGAEDFSPEDEVFEIYTSPETFSEVREALEGHKYEFLEAELQMVPQNYIALSDPEDIKNMNKLLEMLEDNDDVQNVWHNWEE